MLMLRVHTGRHVLKSTPLCLSSSKQKLKASHDLHVVTLPSVRKIYCLIKASYLKGLITKHYFRTRT